MIIIPEISTVVILVPRTGSGSLRRAIAETYPKSMQLYRHMEADGVPAGYDRYKKVGVVRNPVDRLWSLYKFCRSYEHAQPDQGPTYVQRLRRQVAMPFGDWLIENEIPFTTPYDGDDPENFWPEYNVLHMLPETRKSQWLYLRPDLGTEIFRFDDREGLMDRLGLLSMQHHNKTEAAPPPDLTPGELEHFEKFFAWDLAATGVNLRQNYLPFVKPDGKLVGAN